MRLKIKKLILDDFKAFHHAEYSFVNGFTNVVSDYVSVKGMNGIGKTSIMTAWVWLTVDKDASLNSNPSIRPNDGRECVPTVTAVLDIDGTEVTISKMQKQKKSKPDDNGLVKVSLTNSYEINSVPKSERDFKAYLEEKGIDFNTFLVCSHPNVFTGQKAKEMRELLFKMSTAKTDYDIASGFARDKAEKEYNELSGPEKDETTVDDLEEEYLCASETEDVARLLKSYKFEEIEAMQKATIKKVNEECGKDGEIIQAKIIGMESSKVDIDVAEHELAKKELERQIAEVDEKIGKPNEELGKLQDEAFQLKLDVSGIINDMSTRLSDKKRELELSKHDAMNRTTVASMKIHDSDQSIESNKHKITEAESQRKQLGEQYKTELAKEFDSTPYIFDDSKWVFDESSTVCSMCGQTLPKEKIEALKADFAIRKDKAKTDAKCKEDKARNDFEIAKKQTLDRIVKDGFDKKNAIKLLEDANSKITLQINCYKEDLKKAQKEQAELEKQLSELPTEVDYTTNAEYVSKNARLTEIEQKINAIKDTTTLTENLKNERIRLVEELDKVKAVIAKAENNVTIDEHIAKLREQQIDYEQKKADAEKILYELSLVSKRKNELLIEEINSHFNVVKFQLFDYQKNGEYKEVCIPTIDGFRFGESTNTGREILAKLDICNGFQNFFDTHYPVFLDGAESLNSDKIPKMDCQLITLNVTEDQELKVESEE